MNTFKKIVAVLMILISIVSLAISLFMAVQLWKNKPVIAEKVVNGLTTASATLETTAEGLVVVNDTLGNASTSINTLADTTLTLADNVNKTSTTIDSFTVLFTEDIPATVTNTQAAILASQQSAAVIDGVLLGLSSVPLIGIEYDPQASLSISLGAIADTLEPLPGSIQGIGDDLDATGTSLVTLETDIQNISANVLEISKNLDDAQAIVEQYQEQIDQLRTTLQVSLDQAPNWINLAVWSLTFVLIWLVAAQLGLLVQGIHLVTS